MRGIVEQQCRHLTPAHDFQELQLIVRRVTQLCTSEIAVARAEQQLRRPIFIRNRLPDRAEDLFGELPAVVEILGGDLDWALMIMRRQQNQVLQRQAQLALHTLAQNGRRHIQAVQVVIDENDSPRAIEKREHARMHTGVRDGRIGLVSARAKTRPVRGDIDLGRPGFQGRSADLRREGRRACEFQELPAVE